MDAQSKIAVSANLVLLPVKVTDGRGTFVSHLKMEDFRVFEDGQLQKLTVFEEGDTPVTVGLIVDHSRSMGAKLPDVVAAVTSFAHSSNSQDEMFVVDFNDDVLIELMRGKAFSSDAKELAEALRAVSARGRTALYDAVSEGLHHLQYGHLEKKALLIISDGGDNASHLKYSQVLAQARQSQALIYSIALVGSDNEEENPGLLRRLCKDTGGIAYFPRAGESVTDVSTQIARDLREQYTLGYAPQNTKRVDAFRKIEVKVGAPGRGRLHVRTREGYSLAAEKHPTAQLGSETR
ncbi:MAG TPA: VWA domain-containing protein [Candidatus Acidoferrales bacterium]|nr:VWA domain-containing protein [Candidatus Acidoferrales bacterium]